MLTIAHSTHAKTPAVPDYVPGEIIIKLKGNSKAFNQFGAMKSLNENTYLIKNKSKKSLADTITELNQRSDVEYAEYNYIVSTIGHSRSKSTKDPEFGKLWGLINTGDNEPKSNGRNSSAKGKVGADINVSQAWKIQREVKI